MKLEELKEIALSRAISGYEQQFKEYLRTLILPFVDEVICDNLGSITAIKNATGPKVMLSAHIDEIGMIVTGITKEGFIKFTNIGGWLPQTMGSQVWEITTKKGIVNGVTGQKPPHLVPANKRNEILMVDVIDIGAKDKNEAIAMGIELGQMITPKSFFLVLGSRNVMSKALDNRIGVAALIEILRQLKETDCCVYATFSTLEEVGSRGAKTSSHQINPDIAFSIDSGLADDTPSGIADEQKLGGGPQIHLFDAGLIPNQALRHFVIEVAKEENISYQQPIMSGGRTDVANISLNNIGVPSLAIGIPTRYMHSHTSIVSLDDFDNTVKLILAVLKKLDDDAYQKMIL